MFKRLMFMAAWGVTFMTPHGRHLPRDAGAPRRVILVRHAETDWNRDGRYQGQRDVPLNDVGIEQCHLLRARLQQLAQTGRDDLFDRKNVIVFSSDLMRARESAKLVFGDRPIFCEPALRETHYGKFEGLTRAEIDAQHADEFRLFQSEPDYTGHGGEARSRVRERARLSIENILRQTNTAVVVVMTHGGVQRQLVQHSLADGEMPTGIGFRNLACHDISITTRAPGTRPSAATAAASIANSTEPEWCYRGPV